MEDKEIEKRIQERLSEIWEEICEIERVIVMIPTNYTPNSLAIRIPSDRSRGEVYSVSATPFDHMERIMLRYLADWVRKD